jgi:hypothetical protein
MITLTKQCILAQVTERRNRENELRRFSPEGGCAGEGLVCQWGGIQPSNPFKVWRVEPGHHDTCEVCSKNSNEWNYFVVYIPPPEQCPSPDLDWAEEVTLGHFMYPAAFSSTKG